MMNNDKHWKLDRRIPVAVVIALFMQMMGAIVWATSIDARVNQIEQNTMGGAFASEKFARIEERLEHLKEDIVIIRRQLENLSNVFSN